MYGVPVSICIYYAVRSVLTSNILHVENLGSGARGKITTRAVFRTQSGAIYGSDTQVRIRLAASALAINWTGSAQVRK
jgi:hypothetical protein